MPIEHVKLAFEALQAKQAPYNKLFRYYDGDQPVMYTASRLEEVFRGVDARFTQNWCAVVIDAVKDRINLRTIRVPDAQSSAWNDLWMQSELALESDECHEGTLVAGESFVIVDNDGQAYYNDPRLVHVFYDAAQPRVKRWAAKWWVNDDDRMQMSLYYPDRIERYVSNVKAESVNSWTAFASMPGSDAAQANPLAIVPVFHFRMSRRTVKGDLGNVLPVQNGINKLLADMMVAAEFGAFKQRYIISSAGVEGKLKNAPNEIWELPAGDGMGQQTQAGQFEETPLKNYLEAIDQAAMSVSSITRTPKHYFFSIGSNLSGESLMVMEAPLVKKAQDRVERFAPVWQQVALSMLRAKGQAVADNAVEVEFDRCEVVQPRTQAETRELSVRAGMPLVTALRDEGKSQAYIDQMLSDKQKEEEQTQNTLANSLLSAQKRFNQGGQ